MVKSFIRMAEGQGWRHQPINRKGCGALGTEMVVHRRASFWCRRPAGRVPTGLIASASWPHPL
jgi:hypothetical protein